ncbi:amino acid-binding protein [Candidatus Borkfalkia ceftriaxoniphila]|jgi:ACT domain protein|uniref:Amino acid-binding protein n=1 Tax=Candidatus Borkfalkia ceftriaxoniphila TaxID=2508949 RepID=A0A4Q2KHG5_9FIRM|nr:ACT domain-containing protein [Candidatus Borkfalkia ceftriaxoniphila]RXZ62411.1 amino acid-binding protein [Candidatus Borkfalkia ceftriaxoniphila]
MLVKQLSVFMENRPGRLYKLTHALGQEGIDFVTLSIADTKDYGIVRFIARDNDRAYEILKQAGFTVGQTELIGVEVEDKPNALAEVIALLEEENINIEYLYSFVLTNHNSAKILMRVEDTERAVKLLGERGIKLLSEKIL